MRFRSLPVLPPACSPLSARAPRHRQRPQSGAATMGNALNLDDTARPTARPVSTAARHWPAVAPSSKGSAIRVEPYSASKTKTAEMGSTAKKCASLDLQHRKG